MNLLVPIALVGIFGHIALAPQPAEQEQHNQYEPSAYQSSSDAKVIGQSKPESQSGSQQDEQQQSYWEKCIVWLDQHDGAITAVSTFVIAAFTIALFIATRQLWKSGERHSERELRAYVDFGGICIRHFGVGKFAEGFLEFHNFGQTPAYKLKDRSSICVESFPNTEIHLPEWEDSSACMGPGAKLTLQPRMDRLLTQEEEAEIKNGTKAIYITAEIRYWDAFGKTERYANHRGFYHGNLPGADLGALQHSAEHNDAN
jgi:hypothetical protein